jgi:hypothetical protein
MAIVSRLELDHPALGAAGGVALHTQVEALYKKLGDSLTSRWYQLTDFDNGESVDLDHNFDMDIALLRYDIYIYVGAQWTKVTTTSTPALSAFTVIEKVGDEDNQLTITNVSGGNDLLAAVVISNDPLYLAEGDIEDIDIQTVAPEDGQALVYESASKKFKPGASGDASFKVQSIAANGTMVIKGGYLIDDSGREYATHDGAGSASTDHGVDITFDVDTLVASPVDNTTYNLYLDKALLSDPITLTDNSREVISVTGLHFVALTATPDSLPLERYIPIGFIRRAVGTWSTTIYGTFAFRRHQDTMVVTQPLVYEDADHSIGTVGSAGQLATYGDLVAGDFTDSTKVHWYKLNSNASDGSPNTAIALTANGTPAFTGVGFFGRENVYTSPGGTVGHSSTDSFFRPAASRSWAVGCWAYHPRVTGNNDYIATVDNAGNTDRLFTINYAGSGNLDFRATNTAGAWDATISVPVAQVPVAKWFHIAMVYDFSTTTLKAYIDGQKVGTASLANTRASTGSFFLGVGSALTQSHEGLIQDFFFVNDLLLSDADVNKIYSKRFKGQQLAGGHVLDADSFPLTSLVGKATFYNLSANANDGSANAKNLTNNGSTPFTGLGLFGAADAANLDGVDDNFSSTDAFFNYASGRPFAMGGWFALADWTPSGTSILFSNFTSSSDRGPYVFASATNLYAFASTNGTSDDIGITTTANVGLVDGSWHHVALVFDGSTLRLYLDGVVIGSTTTTGQRTMTAPTYRIGAYQSTASGFMKGRVRESFFIKDVALSDNDLLKLMSARLDLPGSVLVGIQDQNWKTNVISEDGKTVAELSDASLLDKKNTKAYLYFGGASASRANIRLYDGGLGATAVPVRKFDRIYTSTPPTTIAHNLPSMPTHVQILHNENADGRYRNIAQDASVKADGVNIYVDLSSYTIDATRDVRIVASIGTPFVAADSNVQQGLEANGTLNMVNVSYLEAVNGAPSSTQYRSEILGRAKIVNLASDLLPRLGNDRIETQAAIRLDGEVGPANEYVYKPINDRFDQVRFYGNWVNNNNSNGLFVQSGSQNDVAEVVFYGTGLNMLTFYDAGVRTVAVTVNGGTEGAGISGAGSGILGGRNTTGNILLPIVAGLSPGLHTVKIRATTTAGFIVSGFEVLNETTNLRTTPGTALVNGLKRTLSSVDAQSYNSGFDSGTLGTRGGRVVVYMRKDGTIGKSVQPVATSQTNLTSVNRSTANEEVIRSHHIREFGAGRSDDWSSAVGTSGQRAFTLDDGTTTLASATCNLSPSLESWRPLNNNEFITLTFVGTGLDIERTNDNAATSDTINVLVDGVSIGNLSTAGMPANVRFMERVVSGLPYGTHTVKFNRTAGGTATAHIGKFVVFGPKKPTLPAGAMELADYNIMADYVANATAGVDRIATGVLRKQNTREMLYTSTWVAPAIDVGFKTSGFEVSTTTNGASIEYVFFGTGFELRGLSNTAWSSTVTAALQNLSAGGSILTLNSTNFPGLTTSNYGGYTFTYASGNLAVNTSTSADTSGFRVSGLTLGLYKIRLTNGTANIFRPDCFDIITPIHVHKNNGPFVLQNTLAVGSQGIADRRYFGEKYLEKKASHTANQLLNKNIASTTQTPVDTLFASFYAPEDGEYMLSYRGIVSAPASTQNRYQFYLDGAAVGGRMDHEFTAGIAAAFQPAHLSTLVSVTKGQHMVMLFGNLNTGGTAQFFSPASINIEKVS